MYIYIYIYIYFSISIYMVYLLERDVHVECSVESARAAGAASVLVEGRDGRALGLHVGGHAQEVGAAKVDVEVNLNIKNEMLRDTFVLARVFSVRYRGVCASAAIRRKSVRRRSTSK